MGVLRSSNEKGLLYGSVLSDWNLSVCLSSLFFDVLKFS